VSTAAPTTQPTPAISPAQHVQDMKRAVALVCSMMDGTGITPDEQDFLRTLTLTELDMAFRAPVVRNCFEAAGVEHLIAIPINAASLFIGLRARPDADHQGQAEDAAMTEDDDKAVTQALNERVHHLLMQKESADQVSACIDAALKEARYIQSALSSIVQRQVAAARQEKP
jgi:hypothetical protein